MASTTLEKEWSVSFLVFFRPFGLDGHDRLCSHQELLNLGDAPECEARQWGWWRMARSFGEGSGQAGLRLA
jgi:hypothetical protein